MKKSNLEINDSLVKSQTRKISFYQDEIENLNADYQKRVQSYEFASDGKIENLKLALENLSAQYDEEIKAESNEKAKKLLIKELKVKTKKLKKNYAVQKKAESILPILEKKKNERIAKLEKKVEVLANDYLVDPAITEAIKLQVIEKITPLVNDAIEHGFDNKHKELLKQKEELLLLDECETKRKALHKNARELLKLENKALKAASKNDAARKLTFELDYCGKKVTVDFVAYLKAYKKSHNSVVYFSQEFAALKNYFRHTASLLGSEMIRFKHRYSNGSAFKGWVKKKNASFIRFCKENYNPLVFLSRLGEFWVDFSAWAKRHKTFVFLFFGAVCGIITIITAITGYKPTYAHVAGVSYWEACQMWFYITLAIWVVVYLQACFGFGTLFKKVQTMTRKYPRVMALAMSAITLAIVVLIGATSKNFMDAVLIPAIIGVILLVYIYLDLYYSLLSRFFFKKNDDGRSAVGENFKGYMYLAPALIPLLVFTFYPMLNAIIMGFVKFDKEFGFLDWSFLNFITKLFTEDGFAAQHLTFQWFVKTFEDPAFYQSLITTIILVIVTVPLSTGIAVVIAVLLNSIKKLQGLFQTVYFLPYVTAMTAVTAVWRLILGDGANGVLNSMFNLNVRWLTDPDPWFRIGKGAFMGFNNGVEYLSYTKWAYPVYYQMIAFIIYSVWNGLAFKIVIFLTGLQSIDKQVYQAAQIDEASKARIFFKITLPLLAPIMLFITTTSMISAFKTYTSTKSLFLNDPKFNTIVFYMFSFIGTTTLQYDRASAVADLLFIMIMCFTAVRLFVKNKRKDNGPEKAKRTGPKIKKADRILSGGKQ